MVKDSLSPSASTVDMLAHLQKENARALKYKTMETEEKLATYNDFMTRSQILTPRAKSMFMEPYTQDFTLHPGPPQQDDTDLIGVENKPEKRLVPVREKTKKKVSTAIPEALIVEKKYRYPTGKR